MFRFVLLCLLVAIVATASVPSQMNYQGQLADSSGIPLDTTLDISFTIYDSASGGNALWTETQTIILDEGYFSVTLGSTTPIPDMLFSGTLRWLEIIVGNDSPMIPREKFLTVPYAHRVATVDGASGGTITGDVSIIGKTDLGFNNTNSAPDAFVIGNSNSADDTSSSITGGNQNTIGGSYTHIGGGYQNTAGNGAWGSFQTVGGGANNYAGELGAVVAGGMSDSAKSIGSAILGGQNNIAGYYSSVVGGQNNRAHWNHSFIGGGGGDPIDSNSIMANWSAIVGGQRNFVTGDRSAIVGGVRNKVSGSYSFVGGGIDNAASAIVSTIAGGDSNIASGQYSTVCGGGSNYARGNYSFIGGGGGNVLQDSNLTQGSYSSILGGRRNKATGDYSAVTGGWNNTASGYASFVAGQYSTASATSATVAGGANNTASHAYTFAAGYVAQATHLNSFVWGGSSTLVDTTFSYNPHTVTFRCENGARFYTHPSAENVGVQLPAGGGAWSSLCDVNEKNLHGNVNTSEILNKVASLPLHKWSYKSQSENIQHIGPTAQDFYSTFGLGDNNTTISTLDPDGVALAAIQELAKRCDKLENENAELRYLVNQLIQLGNK